MKSAALAAVAGLCLVGAPRADEATSPPMLPPMPKSLEELGAGPRPADAPPSMEGYAAVNPGCLEWSDGCQICRIEADKTACSTVAIACKREAAPKCVKPKS